MFLCPECGEPQSAAGYCPADGAALAPRGDDRLLGQSIGPYRVARLLGVGGMGRVYKGVHPAIGSRVAIKVLSQDCTQNRELVERFFAEARAVNLIRHESIVNVLDLATLSDGRPYIVMEYLDGAALADVLETQGALPLGGLARLVGEVLDALAAAHAKGIVHRDLKPDNIFVSPQGRAKVLDFGIAKLMPELSGRSGPTRTGSLLGTPHYMAPEQAMAQAVDARTDVYAMGVILFEGATGQRPFAAGSLFELLHKHIHEAPPRPMALRPELPPGYEAVILRALAKDPAHRFQSVAELAQALAHAAQALPQQAWTLVSPSPASGVSPLSATPAPTPAPTPASPPVPALPTGPTGPRRGRAAWWIGGLAAMALVAAVIALAATGPDDGDSDSGGPGASAPLADLADLDDLDDLAPAERIAAAQELSNRALAQANRQVQEAQRQAREAMAKAGALGAGTLPGTYVPDGFDPERFDITGFLPEALSRAREHYPDAVLVRIDAQGVHPSGLADLTLGESYSVLYRFNSPSRAERPADLPLGADHEPDCKFYVWVSSQGVRPYAVDGWDCEEPALGAPDCSVAQVWKRAIAQGAPADNAVATIGYRDDDGTARWYVNIADAFSTFMDDTCK